MKEILQLLINVLMILPFISFPYLWGYDDGYMKEHGTENHKVKWFMYGMLAYFCLFFTVIGVTQINAINNALLILLCWGIIYKPLFDYGWGHGRGYDFLTLYIGETSGPDILIRKLGLYKSKATFLLYLIYGLLIFIGSCLIVHFSKGLACVVMSNC